MTPAAGDGAAATTMSPTTMSEAERYQRLRSHLAFLRLPTATEALPEVLDQARAEGWGLLATLERLLAAEVEATEARRLASRLRFACLPAPWRIADFDFSAQPGVDESLIRELATLRFLDTAANLLFLGPPGVGKTMLAIGLARPRRRGGPVQWRALSYRPRADQGRASSPPCRGTAA